MEKEKYVSWGVVLCRFLCLCTFVQAAELGKVTMEEEDGWNIPIIGVFYDPIFIRLTEQEIIPHTVWSRTKILCRRRV